MDGFHPWIARWFFEKFGSPTTPQAQAWPAIAAGKDVLVAAPTGSGKTLAAFLVCIDRLIKQSLAGELPCGTRVLYVSPLRALSNDIRRNLESPLEELRQIALEEGNFELPIRTAVRTGDTSAAERAAMLRKPPHILVTTPESLYLLLTSDKGRRMLRTVDTTIVDEIHALARDKRGSHLALSLERLDALIERRAQRIGLSATQNPIEEIAAFLVGSQVQSAEVAPPAERSQGRSRLNGLVPKDEPTTETVPASKSEIRNPQSEIPPSQSAITNHQSSIPRPCLLIDSGHARDLDLAIETPATDLAAVCSTEQWAQTHQRLCELIASHRSTLVFVNTRRLAERVAVGLTGLLGEDAVASHHGSLSKDIRQDAELRLKEGRLKAIVATASLEMGIDVGYIDLVCQVGSARGIATFLQRVGRSGHSLGKTPKGRLFPLTRDELIECMALVRAVKRGQLDRIEIPRAPLDILAQQIIAWTAVEELDEDQLFDRIRCATPYAALTREDFQATLRIVSQGVVPGQRAGALVHHDRLQKKLRARKGARMFSILNGGAIPDMAEYRVTTVEEGTFVGAVDEHFAVDSGPGDVFMLGGDSWRVARIAATEVHVFDAAGATPNIPFWFGEAPGRTFELSEEVSRLRADLGQHVAGESPDDPTRDCGVTSRDAAQALAYVAAQHAAIGVIPTASKVVFERFFDESGGMQLVIHAPFGSRITRAWGMALRKRFCRSFDFELQAAADDDGIVLSLGPQHSFPLEQLFTMLSPQNARYLLEQAILAQPMFQIRWRWNAGRALAVARRQGNQRVPPHLIRYRAQDLLAQTFPETVGCLENHHGDVKIPDHPLVKQTVEDCLTEAMDLARLIETLQAAKEGRIEFIPRDTREPSPFCHELLNSNPYTFLDPAGLEDRRTRAVQTRRSLRPEDFRDLAHLDEDAVAQVAQEAWPIARDADELHDALLSLVVVHEHELDLWRRPFEQLVRAGRATIARLADGTRFCVAAEKQPVVRVGWSDVEFQPPIALPPELDAVVESHHAWVEIVRARLAHSGPLTAADFAILLSLPESSVAAALEALEGTGVAMRGQFTASAVASLEPGGVKVVEWCDRRLLARIHRLTLQGLRKRIQPVEPHVFVHYLCERHGLLGGAAKSGAIAISDALRKLQGWEAPAGVWEKTLLRTRVPGYQPNWLDERFLAGETVWGRLHPPDHDDPLRDDPSHDDKAARSTKSAKLTRAAPIAVCFREDLPWLLPTDTTAGDPPRDLSRAALELLTVRGASFFSELRARLQATPSGLDEALRDLAARGRVTSDTFAAIRAMAVAKNKSPAPEAPLSLAPGRWSPFPGEIERTPRDERLDRWCRQLLARYGVVFRDLVAREPAAPNWSELTSHYRRMELRGEVRGGRFVLNVAGEQYAEESAVGRLREVRDELADPKVDEARDRARDWALVAASDPIAVCGTIGDGEKIAANHKNLLVIRRGRLVAARNGQRIEFYDTTDGPLDGGTILTIRKSLIAGSVVERDQTVVRVRDRA